MVKVRLRRLGAVLLGWLAISNSLPAAPPEQTGRDVAALAEAIDQAVASKRTESGAKPTHAADDAEFMRRVYLDLNGRIPTVAEARRFLDDTDPDKRLRLVERLLARALYVEHFTTVWLHQLLPQSNDQQVQFLASSLEPWLHKQFRDNVRYDRMVRELLTSSLAEPEPRGRRQGNAEAPLPTAFYQVNESKAENLAAATSRLFLGIKLECAQCHDHPFAKWSRKQFWEYAAFFSGIQQREPRAGVFSSIKEDPAQRVIKVAGKNEEYEARFLDGRTPAWKTGVSTRTTLADW